MRPSVTRLIAGLCCLFLVGCGGEGQEAQPSATPAPEAAATATLTMPPAPTATATLEPGTFVNPVLAQDFPDPDVLKVGDSYYAYATNAEGRNIQVARSENLVEWEILGDALPELPEWARHDFGWAWAPEVTTGAGGPPYVMYFTARYRLGEAGGRQCIGVATSATPEGPFEPQGDEPFICQHDEGGSIDASSFGGEDGSRYLLWKNDGNCCGYPTWLYIQPLSDDGLTLEAEPTRLLTRDQTWEGLLVEAPTLWEHESRYYLFYSANDYASPSYAVGYATSEALLGPYEKAGGPLLATNATAGVVGPGGQDIVTDDEGDTWLLYHAWSAEGTRTLRLDPLVWEDGEPHVTLGERAPQPVP